MKIVLFFGAILMMLGDAASAQQSGPRTFASELGARLGSAEREVLQVGEAMPEDKYGFAPKAGQFEGVRTFAQQLKHIGAFGYVLCSGIRQENPPVDVNGDAGPDSVKSKADILTFVRESFAYCRQALDTITPANALEPLSGPARGQTRLGLATFAAAHPLDHYGQIVVYLRMNGKIPPASLPQRGQPR